MKDEMKNKVSEMVVNALDSEEILFCSIVTKREDGCGMHTVSQGDLVYNGILINFFKNVIDKIGDMGGSINDYNPKTEVDKLMKGIVQAKDAKFAYPYEEYMKVATLGRVLAMIIKESTNKEAALMTLLDIIAGESGNMIQTFELGKN